MRVIFMGTPDFSVGTLEEIIKAGHEVVLVVSQPDKAVGRSKALKYTPVKECAIAHGIEVYQPEHVRDSGMYSSDLKSFHADIMIVVAFGQIIPKAVSRHAKIWMCECTCIATAKISWRSTDPVGCHQRRSRIPECTTHAHGRRCGYREISF